MGELDDTVAVITGAARGQGRSHAVALAEKGADIIAVDICADIDEIPYSLGTRANLDKTARLVEATGRKVVPIVADVRDLTELEAAVQAGIDELGDVDIAIANAGVVAIGNPEPHSEPVFNTIVDTNLKGVWHTMLATVPSIIRKGRGGSVVLVSSSQGLTGRGGDGSAAMFAYAASKHGVVGLM
jgi:NAD(P)-dependent dehydrogenase (short-subunit alcohol dehydrogenase family)